MNKQQKIALIRQYLSGVDLSESRCYILEVGEPLPADYRRSVDRVIWVTDDKREIKTGKNDILVQVTSKETVKQVKKLGDYLDNHSDVRTIEPTSKTIRQYKWVAENTSCTRVQDLGYSHHREVAKLTPDKQEPTPPIEPPAPAPSQPRTIPNPRAGYRRTHI